MRAVRFTTPVSLLFSSLLFLGTIGCMHPAGMGPGYMSPYQPMYGQPGGMAAPGTYVVPQGNAPLYTPSNSATPGTFEAAPTDGFDAPAGSSDGGGGVPKPKDPGTSSDPGNGSNSPFFNDIPQGN